MLCNMQGVRDNALDPVSIHCSALQYNAHVHLLGHPV